jgi:hypothetical protein
MSGGNLLAVGEKAARRADHEKSLQMGNSEFKDFAQYRRYFFKAASQTIVLPAGVEKDYPTAYRAGTQRVQQCAQMRTSTHT